MIRIPGFNFTRWPGLKTFLLCALIFLSGAVAGGTVAFFGAYRVIVRAAQHPDDAPDAIISRMKDSYGLTDEQTRRIRAIIERRHGEIRALRNEFVPQLLEQLDGIRSEVAEVMNAEQAERWNRRFETLHRRWIVPILLRGNPGEPGGEPSSNTLGN